MMDAPRARVKPHSPVGLDEGRPRGNNAPADPGRDRSFWREPNVRNILALIGAAVVIFVGLGWYLGWYTFALQAGSDGKQRIQLDVDTHKITDDVKKVGQTVGKTVQEVKEKSDEAKPAEFVGPPLPPHAATPGQASLPSAKQ
jgi:hypothetical protein